MKKFIPPMWINPTPGDHDFDKRDNTRYNNTL